MPLSGSVWMVSEGVWMVSGDVWMVCKGVWGCINTKSICKGLYQVRYCLFFQCPLIRKIAYVRGCLRVSRGCLDGVWGVSEASWILPGGISVNPSDKSSSSVIFFSHGLFSQWPLTGLKCQASPNRKVAMAGGYFRDRAQVFQHFCSIFMWTTPL